MKRLAIVVCALAVPLLATTVHKPARAEALSLPNVWHFVTAPTLTPPKAKVVLLDPDGISPGLVFTSPWFSVPVLAGTERGPLIMDNAGNPVWIHKTNPDIASDFEIQNVHETPYLTWFQGRIQERIGGPYPFGIALPGGQFRVFDSHYQRVYTVTGQNDWNTAELELILTARGTALFTVHRIKTGDLTCCGGTADGKFIDYGIQEIDLTTNQVVFQWDLNDHVPVSETHATCGQNGTCNPYELNSIDLDEAGQRLLISVRSAWTLYEVDYPTGAVLARIGGNHSDFKIGPESAFHCQHHARYRPGDRISMFNDGSCDFFTAPPFVPQRSHGLIVQLDRQNHVATLVKSYFHNPALFADSQGNMDYMPNGNKFVAWGEAALFQQYAYSEYTEDGSVVYDVTMPGTMSYRTRRFPWVGQPLTKPAICALRGKGNVTVVDFSWNGATEVTQWQLRSGPKPDELSPAGAPVPKEGFETAITEELQNSPYFSVEALDRNGQVLAVSETVKRGTEKDACAY